jgi:hypothetical protein
MAVEFDPVITDALRRAGFVAIALDGHPVGIIHFDDGRVCSGAEDHAEPTVRAAALVFRHALTREGRTGATNEESRTGQDVPFGAPNPFIATDAEYRGLHPGIVEAYDD